MADATLDWAYKLGTTVIIPVVLYVGRLANQLSVLTTKVSVVEKISDDRQRVVDDLIKGTSNHSERIAVIEKVVESLESVGPALTQIAITSARMQSLQEAVDRRLQILEDRVLSQRDNE